MRHARNLFASLLAVMALMFALSPAQAFAGDPYPTPDEIWVNEMTLADVTNEGISYDESTGTLTLDGYDGANIHIIGFFDTFTIDVKSDTVLRCDDESMDNAPLVAMSPNQSTLVITSSTGAELQLIATESEGNGVGAIGAWGDIRIEGNVSVFCDVTSTAAECDWNVTGISSDFGNIIVDDEASVYVAIDAKDADRCAAFLTQHNNGYTHIATTKPLYVNCSAAMNNGVYTCGVLCSDSDSVDNQALYITNCPLVDFVANDAQAILGHGGAVSYSDPNLKHYTRSYDATRRSTTYTAEFNQMHRLYNQWTGEHHYTADADELSNCIDAGWTYEGIGWCAPLSGDPVYRLYNPWAPGGDHHYTMDKDEYDHLVSVGWSGEGIAWYSSTDKLRINIYREYNPYEFAHNHNYTADFIEHQHLISVGWDDEGIGWYGVGFLDCEPPMIEDIRL